jgi:hypothetical protein
MIKLINYCNIIFKYIMNCTQANRIYNYEGESVNRSQMEIKQL